MSPDQRRHDGIGFALACVLGSIISTQVGASYAKTLFAWVPPVTAVWLRTGWAAAFLIGLYAFRRRTRRFTTRRPSWREQPREAKLVAIGYGVALIVMNWTFYEAIARLPLGIAVTLEFLGPLTVAIIGSRRPVDVLWVLMAGAGIALLGLRPVALDPVGVAFVLLAGLCWAFYIVLGSRVRRHWDGGNVLTLACTVGAIVLTAPAVTGGGAAILEPQVLLTGLMVGFLCSALPDSLDILVLGSIPPALFAILTSLAPAIAALSAWVVLGEQLGATDWVAVICVAAATAGSTLSHRR